MLIRIPGKNYFITALAYRQHIHASKTTASKELKQFMEEGLTVREGKGPTTFYRMKKEEKI